ncbi:MAG TPA: RNA polymerase sigma factor [Candidatus Binatia bacterium]|nr:RNA polymerase sigma factor [Candidatus Binatia bacterium]
MTMEVESRVVGERAEAARAAGPSDAELVDRMAADDLEAFELLFERHRAFVYRTALGLLGDPQAAEEALQDAFARTWQRRRLLRRDVSPLPWLHRVVLNLCYSRLARRPPTLEPIEALAERLTDAAAEPVAESERSELQELVREGIAALPPKQRSVVVCYYLQGLSLAETAELLGLRLGTVKSRLHYALAALREWLEADRRFGAALEEPLGALAQARDRPLPAGGTER